MIIQTQKVQIGAWVTNEVVDILWTVQRFGFWLTVPHKYANNDKSSAVLESKSERAVQCVSRYKAEYIMAERFEIPVSPEIPNMPSMHPKDEKKKANWKSWQQDLTWILLRWQWLYCATWEVQLHIRFV